MLKFLSEFWQFLQTHKKWWIMPLVIFLVLLCILMLLARSSSLSPFMYKQL
jgi:hypothetical protein